MPCLGRIVQPEAGPIEALALARLCAGIVAEKKGRDLRILDMRETLAITDYFVLATGDNRRQIQAIAGELERSAKANALPAPGIEGLAAARWVLVDMDQVVVHVFDEDSRAFYDLENLWADAQEVDPGPGAAPEAAAAGKTGEPAPDRPRGL